MSARQELAAILEQWLQMTQEEGAAIQAADWNRVSVVQARKDEIQRIFDQAARRCAVEDAATQPRLSAIEEFRPLAARIISLLNRNAEAFAARLREFRQRQSVLEETARNLGRIQRSYVQPRALAAWQSYS